MASIVPAAAPFFNPPTSFQAHYPIPATKAIITQAFKRRGLVPSTSRDKRCLVQWTPRSKINFSRAHANTLLISSFFINQGLTHKDRLFAAHKEESSSPIAWAIPCTHIVPPHSTAEELIDLVSHLLHRGPNQTKQPNLAKAAVEESAVEESASAAVASSSSSMLDPATGFILKRSQVNNALGLLVFEDIHDLRRQLQPTTAATTTSTTTTTTTTNARQPFTPCQTKSVLQQYIKTPLLLRGCKFHLRVNVLVTGGNNAMECSVSSRRPQGFVHSDVVAHVASEQFVCGQWDNRWIHVTNHGVQREHPKYDRAKQTLSLTELEQALVEEYGDGTWKGIGQTILKQAHVVVRHVLKRAMERPGDLRPMHNCFECFGFDFIPKLVGKGENRVGGEGGGGAPPFCLQLLEVNGGPALEGMARPELCAKIVEDVLCVVLDPWLGNCYRGEGSEGGEGGEGGEGESKQGSNGKGSISDKTEFIKVWEKDDDTRVSEPSSCLSLKAGGTAPDLCSDKFIAYTNEIIAGLRNCRSSSSEEEG